MMEIAFLKTLCVLILRLYQKKILLGLVLRHYNIY
jgi:hypothetical protein